MEGFYVVDHQCFLQCVGNGVSAGTVRDDFEHQKQPSYGAFPHHIPDDDLMAIISDMNGLPGFDSFEGITPHNIWPETWDPAIDPFMTITARNEKKPSVVMDHSHSHSPSESSSISSVEGRREIPHCIPGTTRGGLMKLTERSQYVEETRTPSHKPSQSCNAQIYEPVGSKVPGDKMDAPHGRKLKRKSDPYDISDFLKAGGHESTNTDLIEERKSKRLRSSNTSKYLQEDSDLKTDVTKKNAVESPAENEAKAESPKDYIHVRARRGEATDSHSLAERVRREKIRERMERLQKLVPGCSKVAGRAQILDEIINYVQSMQNQINYLSERLASATLLSGFQIDLEDYLYEEVLPSQEAGNFTSEARSIHQTGLMAQCQIPQPLSKVTFSDRGHCSDFQN